MASPRVLVLYNAPILPKEHPDHIAEIEILESVRAIEEVLGRSPYEMVQLAIRSPRELLDGLRETRPDVVLNLFEGTADNNASEVYAAGLLDWLGIPYTGCPFHSLVLARSKHQAKRLFQAEGIPTAPFMVVEEAPLPRCDLKFPVIIKPVAQDASIGVSQANVVRDFSELNDRLAALFRDFEGPFLVEEFIPGREITFAVVEMPEMILLPGTEVLFAGDRTGKNLWPILTYDAKWTEDSQEFISTDYDFKATVSPELEQRIRDISFRAFRLLGCKDCARMDFRIHGDTPFLLEVNPNPDITPDRALCNNLWAADITHEQFTLQMIKNALNRGGTRIDPRYQGLNPLEP